MVRMSRFFVVLAFAGFTLASTSADDSPSKPMKGKTNGEAWWNENFERINTDLKKMDGKVDVAFVGDSITARWRGGENWKKHWGNYRAVNMGIGGDRTQEVLWRLENGQLTGYQAKLFVVMIGTNNCWDAKADPVDVAAGVTAVIKLIQSKQPKAKILLMSILPSGDKPNPGREKRAAVNALIAKLAGDKIEYVDIAAKYFDADKTISKEVMGDYLHLAPKGYDIWAESIADKVKDIVGQAKSGK
ncbi:MAG: GDSL-type esterase/lipase family protein [Fimbriiglobus sp.]